jgi:hypothetical protein
MNDETWKAWKARLRNHPPPAGLSDRILARVTERDSQTQPVTAIASPSTTLARSVAPILLWSAAAIVCAARVYSTVGLLVPGSAFAADREAQEQGTSHVELAAADS